MVQKLDRNPVEPDEQGLPDPGSVAVQGFVQLVEQHWSVQLGKHVPLRDFRPENLKDLENTCQPLVHFGPNLLL
jgi:hypothetical protein